MYRCWECFMIELRKRTRNSSTQRPSFFRLSCWTQCSVSATWKASFFWIFLLLLLVRLFLLLPVQFPQEKLSGCRSIGARNPPRVRPSAPAYCLEFLLLLISGPPGPRHVLAACGCSVMTFYFYFGIQKGSKAPSCLLHSSIFLPMFTLRVTK